MNTAKGIYWGLWVVMGVFLYGLLEFQWATAGIVIAFFLTFFKGMVSNGDIWLEVQSIKKSASNLMDAQRAKITELENNIEGRAK